VRWSGATCVCTGSLSGLGSRGFPVDERGEVTMINVGASNNSAPSLGALWPLLHHYLSSVPLAPSWVLLDHNGQFQFLALSFDYTVPEIAHLQDFDEGDWA